MANDQNWNQQENMDQESSGSYNKGKFSKNDPERAAREGRKGGEKSRGRRS